MTLDQLEALRAHLRTVCDREPKGDHVALARSYFEMAIFHLRMQLEKAAVFAGERRPGETGRLIA